MTDFLTRVVLADALDAFWNASIGATREQSDFTAMQTVGAIAQGFAAVAEQLRAGQPQLHVSPEGIQLLLRVEERRVAVIERRTHEHFDLARSLSDIGLLALQQLPCGVDLHITRLGSKTLDRLLNRKAGG